MLEGWTHDEIGFGSIIEKQGNILEEVGLIAFDREVVVGVALFNQVGGEGALG